MFLVDAGLRVWELTRAGNSWSVASETMSLPGRLLAVGADGETLVCGTTNEIILITKQGVTKTVTIDEGAPIRAALSHNRRYLAYTTMDPDLFNSQAISESGWPTSGTRGTMPPQFLQDYGSLHLLDLSTGISSPLAFLHGNCIGFHPSANWLAIGGTLSPETWIGTVSIIDVETKSTKLIWTKKFGHVISELAWSPDGKYLAFLQGHGPTMYVSRGYDASLWIITADGSRSTPLPVAFAGSRMGLWDVVWRND
jgi:WD40 repeat protein